MRRALASVLLLTQLAGCFTYALNVDEPPRDVVGIMAGAEAAVGVGVGVAIRLSESSDLSLGESLLAGVAGVFLLDLAIGLGVNVSDFSNAATERAPHMLRLGGSF